mgnify:CR=1 FL=1
MAMETGSTRTCWSEARCARARTELQAIMWRGAGIVRTPADVELAKRQVVRLRAAFQAAGMPDRLSLAWLELRNLLDVGLLLLHAAQSRQQSCGAHAWRDDPAAAENR